MSNNNFNRCHHTDNFEIVNMLIQSKADINNRGDNERTPLMMVAAQGNQGKCAGTGGGQSMEQMRRLSHICDPRGGILTRLFLSVFRCCLVRSIQLIRMVFVTECR